MKVHIQLDPECQEPYAVIYTNRISKTVEDAVQKLGQASSLTLTGFQDNTAVLLKPAQIIRIYAAAGRIIAVTTAGNYQLRKRLYELEFFLPQNSFVRISRDKLSRTFSSNSKRSHILRTSSRSRRLIMSSIVSFAVWLKCTWTI